MTTRRLVATAVVRKICFLTLILSLTTMLSCSFTGDLPAQQSAESQVVVRRTVADASAKTSALIGQIEFLQAATDPSSGYTLGPALSESDPALYEDFRQSIESVLNSGGIPEAQLTALRDAYARYVVSNGRSAVANRSVAPPAMGGFLGDLLASGDPALLAGRMPDLESIRDNLAMIQDVLENIIIIIQPIVECFQKAMEQETTDRDDCNRACRNSHAPRHGVCFPTTPGKPVAGCGTMETPTFLCRLAGYPPGQFGQCPGKPKPNPNDPREECSNWDDVSDCLQAALVCPAGMEARKVFVDPPIYVRCTEAGVPSSRQVGTWMCVAVGAPNPPIGFPLPRIP